MAFQQRAHMIDESKQSALDTISKVFQAELTRFIHFPSKFTHGC
jgi:hypothetical protein